MDAVEIKQLQVDRFRYLEAAYDSCKGDPSSFVDWADTGAKLGFSRDRTTSIMYWLSNQGLIKFQTTNHFLVTNYGIEVIENAKINPDIPSGPLIAYNQINIGQMINSNIQQGTSNTVLSQTIQQDDLNAIKNLIAKLENSIEKLQIATIHRGDLLANIETIKAQTKSSKPKKQIIIEAFNSIRDILQALPTAQVISVEIISTIAKILNTLGAH